MDITKELSEITRNSENDSKVLLQLPAHSNEYDKLKDLGLNHLAEEALELEKEITEINLLNNTYKSNIIKGKEIYDLCLKYNLRFLPTKNYKGQIPLNLVTQLEEFEANMAKKDKNFILLRSRLYVLAPESEFHIKKANKTKCQPILFYKLPNKNNYNGNYAQMDDIFVKLVNLGESYPAFRTLNYLVSPVIDDDGNWTITNGVKTSLALIIVMIIMTSIVNLPILGLIFITLSLIPAIAGYGNYMMLMKYHWNEK